MMLLCVSMLPKSPLEEIAVMKKILSSTLANEAICYIADLLGEHAVSHLQLWSQNDTMPFYLQERYTGYKLQLFDQQALMLVAAVGAGDSSANRGMANNLNDTPAAIAKHVKAFQNKVSHTVFVVMDRVSSYNRKRLIDQRVSFVVPSKQLYLPQLGMALRESFSEAKSQHDEPMSVVAQLLVLRYLLGLYREPASAQVLAEQLNYSKMTLSRAINELLALELAEVLHVGKEKRLVFTLNDKQLWKDAKVYLSSPVQKTETIKVKDAKLLLKHHRAFIAEETALSKNSFVAEPAISVIAMAAKDWKRPYSKNENIFLEDFWLVQLWRYDPELLMAKENKKKSQTQCVDTFSLYLSMKDETDERISQALDDLLNKAFSK